MLHSYFLYESGIMLSVLHTLGVVYLLQPYFANNIGKRLSKTPKMYFMDTGLCAHLCGMNTAQMLSGSYLSGAFIETYVVSEIVKSYIHNGKTPNIYYYRDSNKEEIDVIIEENNKVYPIEIKQTATPTISNNIPITKVCTYPKDVICKILVRLGHCS